MENTMRNIKLCVAYDGTDYCGWQRQKNQRTVQEVIENALGRIHKRPVGVYGSGRTDSGVHAAGQIANFYTDIKNMEARRFIPALNKLLPQDVRIMNAEEAAAGFHARFSAKARTYRYYVIPCREAFPWERRFAFPVWRRPDLALLNEYARLLKGEMDFSLFAAAADKSVSRFRRVDNAVFFAEGGKIVFEICANAFLWNMVRSVAGTLFYYEEKKLPGGELAKIIQSGKRKYAGPTLPPQGLFLYHIRY
ncbi:MAG: tRNA pseudouridine(38-40) synthase TruA [Treponema sp.]|jgi:tRNA pseudouridine38-40 synthase|nr:tRNA pseudouridine(38-40) synthase TruA [Treponema sp.]